MKSEKKRARGRHRRAAETRRRIRRSPEEARSHILAAARRVFASHGPDAVGLKEVAREAGISHGLITHYFGRYEALVEAVMEDAALQTQQRIVERLSDPHQHNIEDVLDIFFDVMSNPEHGRLVAWAMLSGRASRENFFVRRFQGPRRVVDAIELRLRREHPNADIKRDELEHLIGMVFVTGLSMSFGQDVLWQALGHEDTAERRKGFRRWLATLLRERIASTMNIPLEDMSG